MSHHNGTPTSYYHKFMVMITVLFTCCTANAIEITAPYQQSGDIIAKPQEYVSPTVPQTIIAQNAPMNNVVNTSPVMSNNAVMTGERIYYVRSMTSNNPEYKTRFSILHETPSPKRVAGERLYNLSEEQFRLAVNGNNIRVLDTPVFKLTGINSARGRYGELRLTDGGTMQIQGTSNRFRGNWDIDGTGVLKGNVTPTNLVSAELPASLITYNADGSVRTNEQYIMTFKAMAMGPYNGYWSDGNNMSIWLWGMSKTKTHSREFTYVGLDLGITTTALPKDATNTITTPVAETPVAAAPVTTNGGYAGQPYVPAPQTGGFTNGGGGGFFPVPFPIGGGGGGGTTVITRPFCQEYPNDPSCKPVCERYPNDPSCVPPLDCKKTPNDPRCLLDCTKTPNDPRCVLDCTKTPNDPRCLLDCKKTPNDPRCLLDCTKTPNDPRCVLDCTETPNDPRCVLDCTKTPNDPKCLNPVSEPFGTFILFGLFAGYFIRKRKFSK